MLVPEINYRNYGQPSSNNRKLNATLMLKITLAAKDIDDRDWKIIAQKDKLKRSLRCKLTASQASCCILYGRIFKELF